ncbi:MAG: hypothetical protein AAF206_07085 [Bacteroidota bacterium]
MKKLLLLILLALILCMCQSCTNNAIQPKFLEGEWLVERVNGEILDYELIFRFRESGDFTFCEDGSDCDSGSWLWAVGKRELTIHTEDLCFLVEIDLLSESTFEATFSNEGDLDIVEMTRN